MTDSITGISFQGQVETEGAVDEVTATSTGILGAFGLGKAFSVSSATRTWDVSQDRIIIDYSGIGSVLGDAEQPYKTRFVLNGQAVMGADATTASDFKIDTIGVGLARADGSEALFEATPAPRAFSVTSTKKNKRGKGKKKITKTMFRPTTLKDIGDIIASGDNSQITSLFNGNTINIFRSQPAAASASFSTLAEIATFDTPVSTREAALPSSADAFAAGWSGF